ncbi:MAG: thiamine-phosphate kinase [Pseudomonadota bacterium]|nr:thiamine-phosphate kinase [Pseudomonadota bacterium]
MSEFDLIEAYFKPLSSQGGFLCLGIGDDAAIIALSELVSQDRPLKQELVIASDTLNSDVHFPADLNAADIAYRSIMANLSDMAAMGAKPLGYQLQLSLPEIDSSWLAEFTKGLSEATSIALMGGDTTKGPLSIAITCLGLCEQGQALRRSQAQVGDRIFHSGKLGMGAQGLRDVLDHRKSEAQRWFCRPQAPLALGQSLVGYASSCIDVSDGLVADLGHIAKASHVTARIDIERLALNPEAPDQRLALNDALVGGDDYQLCFTISDERYQAWQKAFPCFTQSLTEIGMITSVKNVAQVELWYHGKPYHLENKGYEHFA